MRALAKVEGQRAQDVFWWLIVHGVFAYDQIKYFQEHYAEGEMLEDGKIIWASCISPTEAW